MAKYKYRCLECGMKSSVAIHMENNALVVTLKIQDDHKKNSPSCEMPELRLGWKENKSPADLNPSS